MKLNDKIIECYQQELKLLSNKLEICSDIPTRDKIEEKIRITKIILDYFDKEQ